ncbi:MAG: hypothetical protein EOM50_20145, partial [Erysipelotrichia bacterium]|nr:hypothetical protein [Erysipelotrichia bacterium]
MGESKKEIIKKMFNYASDEHKAYLKYEAFTEIASVFVDFMRCEKSIDKPTRWVCNAPMGHGKTTVLRSLCRYIITENILAKEKKALLIVIREKGESKKIADALLDLGEKFQGKIKYITSDNRVGISSTEIGRTQIVIITHARFKQLVLGCGDINSYSQCEVKEKTGAWGVVPSKDRYDTILIPRHIIIDEMPDFENTSVFDIGSTNNCIKWFDNIVRLPEMIELISVEEIQSYRKLFNGIFNDYDYDKTQDTTYPFINNNVPEKKKEIIEKFFDLADGIEDLQNKVTLDTYADFIHYRKLLYEANAGKIYRQYYNRGGEKIIVSDFVPYDNIQQQYFSKTSKEHERCLANILILDGTGKYGTPCYKRANFEPRFVKNYNDYTRLTLHHRDINTSSESREKTDTVLKEIMYDFISLQKQKKDIFLLPAKSDIPFLLKQGVLTEKNFKALTIDEKSKESDTRLHLLNTRGKNDIKDVTDMYMTCLPRKSALTFATLAVALYGTQVDIRLRSNMDDDDPMKSKETQWFNDMQVEILYLLNLVAELLQIIHRTALRKIKSKEKINIYIAFQDIKEEEKDISRMFEMMRSYFTS